MNDETPLTDEQIAELRAEIRNDIGVLRAMHASIDKKLDRLEEATRRLVKPPAPGTLHPYPPRPDDDR